MRLSHLAAAATLVALLGAMFVVMQPASAHDLGTCSDPEYLTAAKCRMMVAVDHDNSDSTDDQVSADGSAPASNDPWKAGTHTAANHPPTLTISFNDSDGIVSSGTPVAVTVSSSGILADNPDTNGDGEMSETEIASIPIAGAVPGSIALSWVRVSGELDHPVQASDGTAGNRGQLGLAPTASATDDASASSTSFEIIVPAGTTPGIYTVSASIASAFDYSGRAVTNKVGTATFTVGDAGVGLSEATLSLGNWRNDDPTTVTDETRAESGTEAADATDGDHNKVGINLVATTSNSLGNKSNDGDVNQVTVIAPGGFVTITGALDATTTGDATDRYKSPGTANSASLGGSSAADRVKVGQSVMINVDKADNKPGSVDVYVIMSGNGAAISETLTLNFTGDASSITLGESSSTLHNQVTTADNDDRDVIAFAVGATDSGGNDVTSIPKVTPVVTDPNGRRVAPGRIEAKQVANGGVENARVTVTNKVDAPMTLASGEYTLTISHGSNKATQTFNVVGAADAIAVTIESNTDEVQLGSLLTVTANVTSGGVNVADGTAVAFTSAGALKLTAVDNNAGNSASGSTKAGAATAQFVVSEGSGLGTIIASAMNASGTASVSTPTPEEEAMPEEEASVSCLSELSGFSTWTCGVDSSASEVFELVADRGKSAIHLWNGSAWVRYSVVDDAMVPGSSDFMVTENDILYISD